MVTYRSSAKTQKLPMIYETFGGVDFAKSKGAVSEVNSPQSVNMIRDEIGKVRKRMGYYEEFSFPDPVYGIHKLGGDFIVHAGTKLYKEHYSGTAWEQTLLYSAMAEHRSVSAQFESKLYLLDGTTYLMCDGTTCGPVAGKIPTIKIAGTPEGGGVDYEDVNLLSTFWTQKFAGDDTSLVYQLAFDNLDENPVTCRKSRLDNNTIVWDTLTEGTDFTVDRELGKLTFKNVIGKPFTGGEDRLVVTASKERSRERIDKCDACVLYGLNGQENQLFVTGNPEHKNKDFWSRLNDPTYFGDLSYSQLGQDNSAIIGYSKLGGYLAAHKDQESGDIYIRGGQLYHDDVSNLDKIIYPVTNVLTGSGAIAKYAFANFGEPLFLTKYGIQTITTKELTNRDYEQVRGDRINKRLLAEPNVEDAVGVIYKDFYLVSINGHVYALDRFQKQYEANQANSEFQYTGYYWENVNASCWCSSDRLYFGTPDGKVMCFYDDETAQTSYNDNGEPIYAEWEFPQFVGRLFWSNKTFKSIFLKLKSAIQTGAKIEVCINGIWEPVKEDYISFGYWDFDYVDFNNLNFSTDTTPKKTREKVKIKKLDKVAWRISNGKLNQPFGIESFGFLYSEKGINKGEN